MDIRRLVIYIGLAITSYMLIINWSNDYSSIDSQPVSEQAATQYEDAPMTGESNIAVDGDTPDVSEDRKSVV